MSPLAAIIAIAKRSLGELMDVTPEPPAEELDYVMWGKNFVAALVSRLVFVCMADTLLGE
jgi:hypothetical protein